MSILLSRLGSLAEWYRELSLRTKFGLHSAVSITLLFGALIPGVVYLQTRAALEQAKHRGLQLTKVFAHSSVQAVVAEDFLIMRQIINSIGSEPDVLYAMILDPSGLVLVHSDLTETGRTYADRLSAEAARSENPLLQELRRPDMYAYDFAVPIYVLNERRAVARIGISFEREWAAIHRTRNLVLSLGVVALLVGLALARLQARGVTRAVGQLVRGAGEITKGNLDHRISVNAGGELGQVAFAFNRMTQSIQALIDTSRELSSELDPDVVLRSIAAYALTLVRADVVAIAPYDREAGEARIRVVLGARTDGVQNLLITPGRGIGGWVLSTGEPLVAANYLEESRIIHDPVYDQVIKDEGLISLLGVPITLKGDVVGLLWVANRTTKTFAQEDVDSLQRMAHQAAIAMENARLYAETRLKTARLEALLRVSQVMTSTLDPERIVEVILRAMGTLMEGIVVRLWVAPGEDEVLVPLGSHSLKPAGPQDPLSVWVGQRLVGAVAASGKPVVIEDLRRDPRVPMRNLADLEGLISFLGIPLIREEKLLGVLCIVTQQLHRFTGDEIDLFASFAQQAAIALENARLYQDLRQSHRELSTAQEQLVQKTRMAAIGEIAAAVAHEARNPLGALSNCVQLLRRNPQITGEDAELLQIIHTESRRLNEIISDFLAFGRPRPPRFEEVELHELIEETVALLRRDDRCPASIAILSQFDPHLPKVRADRDQLRQVFWNLLLNAVQALGESGEVRLETRRVDGKVKIRIRDTGPGIPATVLPKIFDPFFTTRRGGTGLGLAIVRRIMQDHGGHVTVDTHQEAGACLVLSLPLAQDS